MLSHIHECYFTTIVRRHLRVCYQGPNRAQQLLSLPFQQLWCFFNLLLLLFQLISSIGISAKPTNSEMSDNIII